MAVDALPSHDSLASLTLPLSPSPLEIKSCERHIELAVRRRPIRQRAVVRPSRRIGRRCIECGASALSIARNLTTIRSLERAYPSPSCSRTRTESCASLARKNANNCREQENCPTSYGEEGGGGGNSIDRWTPRKTNEFKNVNIARRYLIVIAVRRFPRLGQDRYKAE